MTEKGKDRIAGNDAALRKALNLNENHSTDPAPMDPEPLAQVVRAAHSRGLQIIAIYPGPKALPAVFLPGLGYLAMILDDPDSKMDASAGPGAFQGSALPTVMKGANVLLASAVPGLNATSMAAAAFGVAKVKRQVLILTGPKNHTAWADAVERLGGFVWLHVTDGEVPA